MRHFSQAVLLAVCLAGATRAQSGGQEQKPASNPFPEDTTNVPVMPSNPNALVAPAPGSEAAGEGNAPIPAEAFKVHLPAIDADPIHSPDDVPLVEEEKSGESSSSSSLDKILGAPGTDNDTQDRKHHHGHPEKPVKQKTQKDLAAEDMQIGGYYLDKKNWKAAQSRFQSAMVLDPENPEVYWGLAEAARNQGDLYTARGYYLKVVDYDPDGPHSKQLKKVLKDPALLNAKPLLPAPAKASEPSRGPSSDAPKP